MINDPVERWKSRLSKSTWRIYEPYWNKFLELNGIEDVSELLKLSSREASDLAAEFHAYLKRQNYSFSSCSLGYVTVRSFFSHNGITLEKFARKFMGKPQYETEKELTQEEVFRIVEAIPNYRDKGAVGICFQGGQRRGVVCALKLKHITTRDWENASVVVFNVPEYLPNYKGENVNKWEVKYRFGILDDVARYIKIHLDERRRAGEKIDMESWLFRSKHHVTYNDSKVFPITAGYLNEVVKNAAQKIGIQYYVETARVDVRTGKRIRKAVVHAHCGRVYFKTQMRLAGVDPELREFMMGHKLPYHGAYDRYGETEIVAAMEKARDRLALLPKVVSETERLKQQILISARLLRLPDADRERLEQMLAQCTNAEEIERVLEKFNGKERLEKIE